MAFNITRGKQNKAVKSIIYGQAGIGKSTFAAAFPEPLFIDTEDSTVNMDVARFDKPTDWNILLAQVKEVKNNPSLCRTLVIDTADWAERLCEESILKKSGKTSIEDFGYGKGYVLAKEEFGRLLDLLSEVTDKGINVVLTAHSVIRKFELPDEAGAYDRYELKLGGKSGNACAALAKEWSDLLLFANYKTEVTEINGKKKAQGGRRVMYTQYNPCWDAKNRFGLKEMLPFDFKEIAPYITNNKTQNETAPPTKTTAPVMPAPVENPVQNEDKSADFVAKRNMYFVNKHDKSLLFKLDKGETMNREEYEQDKDNWQEISAEEYDKQQKALAEFTPLSSKQSAKIDSMLNAGEPDLPRDGIDQRLLDLCDADGYRLDELVAALKRMGQMPADASLNEAPPEFVAEIVAHWAEVVSEMVPF